MRLSFRPATTADESAIRDLQREAATWLKTLGTDQWQPDAMRTLAAPATQTRSLEAAIARSDVWIATIHDSVVATFTIDTYADPDFWTPHEAQESALYIHRMIVARSSAGRDIGASILDFAEAKALSGSHHWLRLDAWRTNHALHTYYIDHGFKHIRTVARPHRGSGALFEKHVTEQPKRPVPLAGR